MVRYQAVFLSDRDIRQELHVGGIGIRPFNPAHLQPASYDLTLGADFKVTCNGAKAIDPFHLPTDLYSDVRVPEDGCFILRPGNFVLGTTVEYVQVSHSFCANVEGKSSLARLGLVIHHTGGFIDPGFNGQVTLEFSCQTPAPIKLWPGMRIAQLRIAVLSSPCERPYGHPELGSKYQGQTGVVESRYSLNTL